MSERSTSPGTRCMAAIASAAALLLGLSACGGGAESQSVDGMTSITVGAIPVSDYAPLSYALEHGYFDDEGLDVEVQALQGGSAAVPGLLSGDLQISVTNWVSFVQAQRQGIPIQAFAPGAVATPGWSGLYAAESSGIEAPEDLAGKTVAINELEALAELTSRAALSDAGIDPDSVAFTTLPLNTIVPAVAEGKVDGGWLVDPFVSQAKAQDQHQVLDVYRGLHGASIGGYITSREWASENPDALERFSAALLRATAELNAKPELVEETLISTGAMKKEQRGSLMLPTFGESLTVEDVQQWADLMFEYDFVETPVDVGEAVLDVG